MGSKLHEIKVHANDRPRLQNKLTLGQSGDPYEQEADLVAGQVMNTSMPIQHPPTAEEQVQTQLLVQRASLTGKPGQPSLEHRLATQQGSGNALSQPVRHFMESRFGADFKDVRVHTDTEATQMNRQLQSQAFTYGRDIYFGAGHYRPETPEGQSLLAHELTHVIQQTGKVQPQRLQRKSAQGLPAKLNRPSRSQRFNPFNLKFKRKPKRKPTTLKLLQSWLPVGLEPQLAESTLQQESSPVLQQIPEVSGPISGMAGLQLQRFSLDDLNPIKAVKEGVDWAKQQAQKLVNGVRRQAEALLNRVKRQATQLIEAAKGQAKSLIDAAKRQARRLIAQAQRTVKHLLQQAQRQAAKLVQLAQRQVKRVTQAALRQAKQLMQRAVRTTNRLAQPIIRRAQKLVQLGMVKKAQRLIERLRQKSDRILETARSKAMAIAQKATQLATDLVNTATRSAEFVISRVTRAAEQVFTGAMQLSEKVIQGVQRGLEQISRSTRRVTQIAEQGRDRLRGILKPVSAVAGWLIDKMLGIATTVIQWAMRGVEALSRFANQLLQPAVRIIRQITHGLGSLIRKTLQPIVQRIRNGVQTIARRVLLAIKTVADQVLVKGLNIITASVRLVIKKATDLIEALILKPLAALMELAELVMKLMGTAGSVLDRILEDPFRFIKTLFSGLQQGFASFAKNIGAHLEKGLQMFLWGTLANKNLKFPQKLDLEGLLSIVLQLMNLSHKEIRERGVRKLGEENFVMLEQGAHAVATGQEAQIINDQLKSSADAEQSKAILKAFQHDPQEIMKAFGSLNFKELMAQVMDGFQTYLVDNLIKVAIPKMVAYFAPGAGWVLAAIDALKVVYSLFIENSQRLAGLVTGISQAMLDAANHAVNRAAHSLEVGLGQTLPMLMQVLADWLGIGDMGKKMQEFLTKGKDWVDRNLLPIVDRLFDMVAALFASIPRGGR
jgi:hypothetical protein